MNYKIKIICPKCGKAEIFQRETEEEQEQIKDGLCPSCSQEQRIYIFPV